MIQIWRVVVAVWRVAFVHMVLQHFVRGHVDGRPQLDADRPQKKGDDGAIPTHVSPKSTT